jgi:hypothetical protein
MGLSVLIYGSIKPILQLRDIVRDGAIIFFHGGRGAETFRRRTMRASGTEMLSFFV